jgi:hypothetical protein
VNVRDGSSRPCGNLEGSPSGRVVESFFVLCEDSEEESLDGYPSEV